MEEWQSFILALFKCNVSEWEKEYDEGPSRFSGGWYLYLYIDSARPKIYRGYKAHPPNWDEFMKIIDNMVEKIRKRGMHSRMWPPNI